MDMSVVARKPPFWSEQRTGQTSEGPPQARKTNLNSDGGTTLCP